MAKKSLKKTSSIKVDIVLDENNFPDSIQWNTSDNAHQGQKKAAKAMLLALFDKENRDTLKFDLWTKDMQVIEMDRFFFQTLRSMADTYYRATQNKALAEDMQRFVEYFGIKTEILSESDQKD